MAPLRLLLDVEGLLFRLLGGSLLSEAFIHDILTEPFSYFVLTFEVRFAQDDVLMDGLHPLLDVFLGLWGAELHHEFLGPCALVNEC